MGASVVRLPDLPILIEQLTNTDWIKYYKKLDLMVGSTESMDYLLEFLKNT